MPKRKRRKLSIGGLLDDMQAPSKMRKKAKKAQKAKKRRLKKAMGSKLKKSH